MARSQKKIPPIHPGEVLQAEFLTPFGIPRAKLARETGIPPRRIRAIVSRAGAITADVALRLSRYFGTSERFWLNLQSRYDLEMEKDRLGDRLKQEVKVFAASIGEEG